MLDDSNTPNDVAAPTQTAASDEQGTPDQLSLQLSAELPALPTNLRPMLPRPAQVPFDSPNHLFQPLWGGLRSLIFVGPPTRAATGELRILDADGVDWTRRFPELAGVTSQLAARSAILDGEIAVVDRFGRHDPEGLKGRLAGRPAPPAVFLAFDLLHLDGRSLLGTPLDRRRELLRRTVAHGQGNGPLLVVPAIETDGRVLHAAVVDQQLAGTLARVRTSPYLPGVRSRLWQFVATSESERAIAGASPEETVGIAEVVAGDRPAAPVLTVIARLPLEEA
ncbi:MAG: hypothetical protein C4343_05760 [Chloroflexota bacterium]